MIVKDSQLKVGQTLIVGDFMIKLASTTPEVGNLLISHISGLSPFVGDPPKDAKLLTARQPKA